MLVKTVCSIAVYCQRCGKIHIFDVPYFAGVEWSNIVCESCGHERAILLRLDGEKLEIIIECVACKRMMKSVFSYKYLRKIKLERLYCHYDRFELGYVGRRRKIEEMLEFSQAEFEALHPSLGQKKIELW